MDMRYVRTIAGLVAVSGIPILVACGAPGQTTMKATIKASVERMNPVPPWVCGRLVGCQHAQVQDVHIVETGEKQTTGNRHFWPIKVTLKGTCASVFTGGQPLTFDENREVVFHLFKDEFGTWVAEAQVR